MTSDSARYVVARPILNEQYESLESVPLEVPLVVTLLPGAVGSIHPPQQHSGKPRGRGLKNAAERPIFPGIHPPDPATLDIADAERIVAFGRGAFSERAISLVEQLAEQLGAAVAGTRPAADEGWLPFSRQVGLTGAIVKPRLYVAVGISGAPYHMVGVKEPETLIAINNNADAPILGNADLGIVGDLHDVLPRLISEIGRGKELLKAARDAGGGRRA